MIMIKKITESKNILEIIQIIIYLTIEIVVKKKLVKDEFIF